MVTANQPIVLTCEVCSKPITDGNGFLQIDEVAANDYERAYETWADRHRTPGGGVTYNIADRSDPPPSKVAWHVFHQDCDPDPENEGYAIPAGRCSTFPQLISWTAHLLEKRWLPNTNWAGTLRRVLHDSGCSGDISV